MKQRGFTLIELLIVVAIIAILAAIAVPNFLEAQMRSKVSRVKTDMRSMNLAFMAYYTDFGQVVPGTDDPGPQNGKSWFTEHPGERPEYTFRLAAGYSEAMIAVYYTDCVYTPLTTPVAYMTSVPHDAFTKRMPYAYDTMTNSEGGLAYSIVASCGPDFIAADWAWPYNPGNQALPYDPSNGTKSMGDIWRGMVIKEPDVFKTYFPFDVQ
jgi:prepilin-type N-terminal cleavage/methylation domain-containing protein